MSPPPSQTVVASPAHLKTRIVLVSDTHNQTPSLPRGDVLVHAGDLTNQGSHAELVKTVKWLERVGREGGFEAIVVVAGNHDITLDGPFFRAKEDKWKWPAPQDPVACRDLVTANPYITYLEHEAATLYLPKRRTCLKVFGSPYSPGTRGWAFQYADAGDLWDAVPSDADVVVTHTPARGWVDTATKDERAGCVGLRERLGVVKPAVHVCGHIHEGRGAVRVKWDRDGEGGCEVWTDPGLGNKKISLLDLTGKTGRRLDNAGRVRRRVLSEAMRGGRESETDSLESVALPDNEAEEWIRKAGGALECRGASDVGGAVQQQGSETATINAAFLGPRIVGKAMQFNKPIVVDVELPVWDFAGEQSADVP